MAKELSGALWVSRFPGSSSTNDLQGTFRASVDNFLRALGNARARGSISATYVTGSFKPSGLFPPALQK